MFTVHAFNASTSAPSTLTNVAAVSDPVAAINGNFLFVPLLNNLLGAYAVGLNVSRAQLTSPSMLADVPYDITPVDNAAAPSSPLPILMHAQDPIPLVTDEPLQALVTQTSFTYASIFAFLGDGAASKVSGKILRCRATLTSSATGYTWQNASITLTNQLAEGTYDIVGARAEGAHLLAFRFVFPGGTTTTRPGAPGVGTAVKHEYEQFRNGNMGVWGSFSNRVLPTVDCFTDGNSETVVLVMDLIKK